MKTAYKIRVAPCPDCERKIKFDRAPKLGQRLMCPRCEAFLEVVNLNPLELDWDMHDYDDDWNSGLDNWKTDDGRE